MIVYTNVGCELNVVGDPHERGSDILISFPSGMSVRAFVHTVNITHAEVFLYGKGDTVIDEARLFFTLDDCPDLAK